MKSSTYLSLGLLLLVAAWMLSGALANTPDVKALGGSSQRAATKMKVTVQESGASEVIREIVLQGGLEPLRQVEIRARTTSQVAGLPVAKGSLVATGEVMIELATEDREVQLERARAEVRRQQIEVRGMRKLKEKGLQAETRVKAVEAALASARADLEKARLERDYIQIKAPFAGVLEQRFVELGSHVESGDGVALLVDASVLKAVGRVSQQSVGKLRLGQLISVRLLDGREASGKVTFISRLGDAETRSFRIEAEVPNEQGLLTAGVSAEIRIAVGREDAHFVSPAVLSLDSGGNVGVKTVTDEGVVQFHPITLVRTDADGVWVTGLPAQARVISQGQGFVDIGESVVPVPAG